MGKEIVLNMGDLRRFIKESSKNEFKPVLGSNVEKDNKSNNDKTYKETETKIKNFDGKVKKEEKKTLAPKEDYNRTSLDYTPKNEPSKEYKEKVEAQAKGYTSKLEQENDIEKNAQFDEDGKILKHFKDSSEEINKKKAELAHSGLQARELEKPKTNTLYEGKTLVPKKLTFKRKEFLNEAHMLSCIPETYKQHGQKIYMIDASENEYLVECIKDDKNNTIETSVVSYRNQRKMNEQYNRINSLFDYKQGTTSGRSTNTTSLNEEQQFKELMDKMRNKK